MVSVYQPLMCCVRKPFSPLCFQHWLHALYLKTKNWDVIMCRGGGGQLSGSGTVFPGVWSNVPRFWRILGFGTVIPGSGAMFPGSGLNSKLALKQCDYTCRNAKFISFLNRKKGFHFYLKLYTKYKVVETTRPKRNLSNQDGHHSKGLF